MTSLVLLSTLFLLRRLSITIISFQNHIKLLSKIISKTRNLINTNILVTEAAEQDLTNKTVYDVTLKSAGNTSGQVILSVDNITGPRTIRFPDSNATLLSTENVTLEDVNFGAGIGANNLSGLTRQQQFFYSGF